MNFMAVLFKNSRSLKSAAN